MAATHVIPERDQRGLSVFCQAMEQQTNLRPRHTKQKPKRKPYSFYCFCSYYSFIAQALRFLNQTKYGVYIDEFEDCPGMSEEEIQAYYGTQGAETTRQLGQTGAGHAPEEDGNEHQEVSMSFGSIAQEIEDGIQGQIGHEPIPVPKHESPFPASDLRGFQNMFFTMLNDACDEGLIPHGYGVAEEELVDGWEPSEIISSGRRRNGLRLASLLTCGNHALTSGHRACIS
jgi:hypothetical protein